MMRGERKKEMMAIAEKILDVSMSEKVTITAEYLSGSLNARAGLASRYFQYSNECLLSARVSYGKPEVENCRNRSVCIYNPGHNIMELYNILVQIRFTTSKRKLDI